MPETSALIKIKDKYGPESIALTDREGPFRDMHRGFLRGLGTPNYCNHDAFTSCIFPVTGARRPDRTARYRRGHG